MTGRPDQRFSPQTTHAGVSDLASVRLRRHGSAGQCRDGLAPDRFSRSPEADVLIRWISNPCGRNRHHERPWRDFVDPDDGVLRSDDIRREGASPAEAGDRSGRDVEGIITRDQRCVPVPLRKASIFSFVILREAQMAGGELSGRGEHPVSGRNRSMTRERPAPHMPAHCPARSIAMPQIHGDFAGSSAQVEDRARARPKKANGPDEHPKHGNCPICVSTVTWTVAEHWAKGVCHEREKRVPFTPVRKGIS